MADGAPGYRAGRAAVSGRCTGRGGWVLGQRVIHRLLHARPDRRRVEDRQQDTRAHRREATADVNRAQSGIETDGTGRCAHATRMTPRCTFACMGDYTRLRARVRYAHRAQPCAYLSPTRGQRLHPASRASETVAAATNEPEPARMRDSDLCDAPSRHGRGQRPSAHASSDHPYRVEGAGVRLGCLGVLAVSIYGGECGCAASPTRSGLASGDGPDPAWGTRVALA